MKGRILAVDDELHMLKLIERLFTERSQHQVRTTNNSLEVPSLLANERFDVIITDLRMPGLDGAAVLRWVTEHDRDEQVIVITAFGSVESAREAVQLGAFDFLNKPFKQETLLFSVDRALRYAAELKAFRRTEQLLFLKPLDEAVARFRRLYLEKLSAVLDGDRQAVAEQAGLSDDEVRRLLDEAEGGEL